MSPQRILHCSILHWLPLNSESKSGCWYNPEARYTHPDTVEEEDDPHDGGGDSRPGDPPVAVRQHPRHLLHVARELGHPVHPADSDGLENVVFTTLNWIISHHLEEAAPEDGDAARPVEVDQLEDVGPALGDHGHSQQEQHDTQAYCELSADGPVVGMEIFLQARE